MEFFGRTVDGCTLGAEYNSFLMYRLIKNVFSTWHGYSLHPQQPYDALVLVLATLGGTTQIGLFLLAKVSK
jgi:hypothetical protein